MKLNIAACALSLGIMCAMTSCNLDTDDSSYTYYDDISITSVTFGTLTRTLHKTKSDGTDSTYTSTYTGTSYPVYIDQKTRTIYNPDSLLIGTRMDKIMITVGTKNSASPYLNLGDSLYQYIQSTDTLDFSEPRQIMVLSNDQAHSCTYTVKFSAHQEAADSFTWSRVATAETLKLLSSVRTVSVGDKIYLLGAEETKDQNGVSTTTNHLYSFSTSGAFELKHCGDYGVGASIATDGESVYVFTPAVYSSESGSNTVQSPASLTKISSDAQGKVMAHSDAQDAISSLVAAYDGTLFAISVNGKLVESSDEGQAWAESTIDEDASNLPVKFVSSVLQTLKTNSEMHRLMLIGVSSKASASVWSKLYDPTATTPESWIYQPWASDNGFQLPEMSNMAATGYGDYIIAMGNTNVEGTDNDGKPVYSQLYSSYDHGVTWKNNASFPLPSDFSVGNSGAATIVADQKNTLWILCSETGQVWRGRMHKMTWTTNQTYFE